MLLVFFFHLNCLFCVYYNNGESREIYNINPTGDICINVNLDISFSYRYLLNIVMLKTKEPVESLPLSVKNDVLDRFNNWTPDSDSDIACILACKWQGKSREKLIAHFFPDTTLDEDLNLHKLAMSEILFSWYDKYHAVTSVENQEVADKIYKLVDELLDKVYEMDQD